MFFSRKQIGVGITQHGIISTLTTGSITYPKLERIGYAPFRSETIAPSLRELNILDPDSFLNCLKSAYNQLLHKNERISLSLPDAVCKIMIVEHEGRFKSREEAIGLIKWKLKKSLPLDVEDTHIDFQQLAVRENGDLALLVVVVSKKIISQYEEMIVAAGLSPARIDCNTLSIARLFEPRISLQNDCLLISLFDNTLSVIAYIQGISEFIRSKELRGVSANDSRFFMEITNSLLAVKDRFPEQDIRTVFCVAPPEFMYQFHGMIAEATQLSPAILETKSTITVGNAVSGDQARLFPCTAAIGAALRGR